MRMKATTTTRCLMTSLAFLLLSVFSQAQVTNPSTWSTFVEGAENSILSDTFRLQTFSGAATDNWNYSLSGNAEIFDPTSIFSDASKNKALRLSAGSRIDFDSYSIEGYEDVKIMILPAMHDLTTKDTLYADVKRAVNPVTHGKLYTGKEESSHLNFTDVKATKNGKYFMAREKPIGFALETNQKPTSRNGFFAFDTLAVFGDIATYSLYKGKGLWSETNNWSHLIPQRRRIALVDADLTIDTEAHCRSLHLHDGNLRFTHNGQLVLDDQLLLHHTFPEKGKWYFFSVPFDVYAEDLDPEFTLKDDTPNEGGNYLYVCCYDAQRRAEEQQATGNWKVVKLGELQDKPLFEKNKGYLVAIDEKASTTTVCLATNGKKLTDSFGHRASIDVESFGTDSKNEHSGWQLCGNPFPSALPLQAIADNADLDGYIYLLENGSYKAYQIGSSYAIPAYSAFFVRTKQATQLEVNAPESAINSYQILKADAPLSLQAAEPQLNPLANLAMPENDIQCFLQNRQLIITDLPADGKATLYDLSGRMVQQYRLTKGSSSHPVELNEGCYIIRIDTPDGAWKFKCYL